MDFKILTENGNIGFYQSCEITELFLTRKKDNTTLNFYTIAVFEEKPFVGRNQQFLCRPISVNKDYNLGIQRYWLSLDEVEQNYETLKTKGKWLYEGKSISIFPKLNSLTKQYVPSVDGNRINKVLKNNHDGSYILEFFDEDKSNFSYLLDIDKLSKLNTLSDKINKIVPIDLSVVRDRIGNFIFQFPVNVLHSDARALKTWDGVVVDFAWHKKLSSIPECLLQVESTFDKNYMGSTIEEYNQGLTQIVKIGNLDQINHIKIWRKEPSLILSTFSGSFIREFSFNMGIVSPEPRLFELDGEMVKIQVSSKDGNRRKNTKHSYTDFINNNLYDEEKKQLEKSLAFKQYNSSGKGTIEDLRLLIKQHGENGVFIWDPFLSPKDIFNTLYFSTVGGVPLKAIGSITDTVKNVYDQKGKTVSDIIHSYQLEFDNPKNNNFHMNVEFRIQHGNFGWSFHDRFLIFPSNELKRSKVYSLGTSINSYGKSHHILQEVSHPQPVVDAFNELWDKLNNSDCLVWKNPK
jgi:hypothetical protein